MTNMYDDYILNEICNITLLKESIQSKLDDAILFGEASNADGTKSFKSSKDAVNLMAVTKTFKIVAATLAPLKTLIENDFKDASKTT